MLTLAFNILNCVYLWTKAMKKLTRNLIEGDSSQWLKILPSTNITTNIPAPDHLDKFLCQLQCFSKTNERKIEASSSQTCPVFKRLQRHINEWILTVLLGLTVNPEDWDVDFAFPNFLTLFYWERSWCRNWIVTLPRKRMLVSVWKF